MKHYATLADLEPLVGQTLGVSEWLKIDQAMIDAFGVTTRDEQWIHMDAERAGSGPFGRTIAHGFLTLSLHSALSVTAFRVDSTRMGLNAGFDRVRFTHAVPVRSRIRGHFDLHSLERIDGGAKLALDVRVEIEGVDKPACVSRWIIHQYE